MKKDTAPGLLRSGGIVGLMTLASRVLGFARDQVLAVSFGASGTMDVFLVAFKIPNFLRRLFGEGAFAQAFVPVFTEYRETRDRAALIDLAAHVSGTFALILLVVSTLGVACAPLLVMLFAPGFLDEPERYGLAVRMLRITFPYLFFVSLLAYAGSILNTFGRFGLPSFAPVLLNVSMIVAALFAAPLFDVPIVALAWGVFFAGVLQLALQVPFLARMGLLPRPRWGWKHSGVRRVMKLMVPALFGSSIAQVNLLLDTILASFLVSGSLSWLYYSDRLMEFPLAMLGVTLGTVILPRLARGHATASTADFRATVDWALGLTLLAGLPAALVMGFLAEPLVSSLFGYGEFGPGDARMSAIALTAYSIGLPAFLLSKVFAPAFYARQDTRTPVRIGIVALVANMVLNLAIVLPMIHFELPAQHAGLALASSLSGWLQAILLYRRLAADDIYRVGPELAGLCRRALPAILAFALAAAGVAAWLAAGAQVPGEVALPGHPVTRVGGLIAILAALGAGYLAALFAFGLRPSQLAPPGGTST